MADSQSIMAPRRRRCARSDDWENPRTCRRIAPQADALALGKDAAALEAEGVAPELLPHKTFQGDRCATL
eukprot:SAG25_NODE_176_length_12787_cov_14.980060_5_plen_70_part_00